MKDDEEIRRLLTIAGSAGMGGFLLGLAKGVIQERHGSFWMFMRGLAASVIVAMLAAFALNDLGMSWTRQAAIIGVMSYVAEDMLVGLLILAKLFSANPVKFLKDVWKSIRGGT